MKTIGLFLLAASAGQTSAEAPGDIIVHAKHGRCEIVYAGSTLDGRGLRKLADGWPEGRPLRVVEPIGADRKCLVRITLDLAKQGFNNLEFVDPPLPDDTRPKVRK
ncbi:hypothetical protein SAMN05518801_11035 [Novosphingobium sp. CF614]|uniref:hypothetical protein n=1 Tax=Novosphingobium sp. CF614 TaxID=1884364 RepID=UPI0008E9B7E3|nr:hypothetical protein [Novosphingobium sp. CF614]SFG20096.1 hypothetical protein SAMN05518801_11035 [Novosphingobium sp. CF614]